MDHHINSQVRAIFKVQHSRIRTQMQIWKETGRVMTVKVLKEIQLKCGRKMVSPCTHPVRRCFSSTFLSLPPALFHVFILLIQPPPVC